MPDNQNEDIKAKMKEALERKQHGPEGAAGGGSHHREKGPAERGKQSHGSMFRRKAGG